MRGKVENEIQINSEFGISGYFSKGWGETERLNYP